MDKLTAKIGPLPAWAWGLIVVVGAYAAYRFIPRGSSDTNDATAGAASLDGEGDATDSSVAAGTDDADYSAVPTEDDDSDAGAVGSSIITPGNFTDDGEWSVYVAQHLQNSGAPAVTVSNALSDYLAGNRLSVAEAALVEAGVTAYGYPPGGVYPINVIPTKTASTTTTTKPVASAPVAGTKTTKTPAAPGHVVAAVTKPATPGGFGLTQTGTSIVASWQSVPGATKYRVTNAVGTPAGNTTGTTLTLPNRTPGRKYSFKVQAYNGAGWGRASALHTITMAKTPKVQAHR